MGDHISLFCLSCLLLWLDCVLRLFSFLLFVLFVSVVWFLFVVLLCLCSAFVSSAGFSYREGLNRTYYWGVGWFMGGPLGSSHFDSSGTLL